MILFLVVLLPTIGYATYINNSQKPDKSERSKLDTWTKITEQKDINGVMFWSPMIFVNFLFFVNVDILFWIIGMF